MLVDKVPIRGYIVIQPDTEEAERLQLEWRDPERPQRYFVPCSWVQACREHGRLLAQIFVKDAYPVGIYIHKTIANVVVRKELADKISVRTIYLVPETTSLPKPIASRRRPRRALQRSDRNNLEQGRRFVQGHAQGISGPRGQVC